MTPTPPADPNLIYFNGIDPDTGNYAIPPASIDALAKGVRARPIDSATRDLHGETPRAFALPFDTDMTDVSQVGWGIICPENLAQDVRDALAPLVEHRKKQAGSLFKLLDYKQGEQIRDWYNRHQIAVGTFTPEVVPYYLLLAGPPTGIPFEFQYLLGGEYAVGRLAFHTAAEYARYAKSVVAYETAAAVANRKEIVYWGTRHLGDPATNLSASYLVEPLAQGTPDGPANYQKPVHKRVNYGSQVYCGEPAVREKLVEILHADRPPALLFTASHGMAIRSGKPNQESDNGGLLCQDWPGFGSLQRQHYLAASDVSDDANVNGTVALLFACFGGGTPDKDQFLMDLSSPGTAPPVAPQPFVAALPQRLLAHPRGSALAVIGHVDRAWSFSIQPPKMSGSQIGPFYNGLCFLLTGCPVGHAVTQQFAQRFLTLSATLLSATSPTTPASLRPSDRDLVTLWLERNDAQNYVVLGDPAVRIRADKLN